VKKSLIAAAVSGVLASCLVAPAMAQNASLDQISRELKELKELNERLGAEVEYLKENAKAQRKEGAQEAVDIANLKTTTSKVTWTGDFRYRHEEIATEGNVTDRDRERIRVRFGAQIKVNDTLSGRVQISTINAGSDNARSTNQTLGNGTAGNGAWDRKAVGIDQAYIDWKPFVTTNIMLGKMPIPWTRTASYFWDGDLTPEGAMVKFAYGMWFANASYMRLSEQDNGSNSNRTLGIARSTDSGLAMAQFGLKPAFGTTVLTVAASYMELSHVADQPVSVTGTGCTLYSAANPTFGGSSYGNTTYLEGTTTNGCTMLLSGFSQVQALAQVDFVIGRLPISVFADFMKNNGARTNIVANDKLNTAISAGFMINKASTPKTLNSWEAGVIYQQTEKDSVFGQFHDSDFGSGITDTKGVAIKAAYTPLANWTFNATYFLNKRFNEIGQANGSIPAGTKDHDYKRLQLDLNFKF
jgi:outer membrane murein-binding lipoprotein Lpp